MEAKGDTLTRYRWFATSDDNEPADGVSTAVGTGTIMFDGNGNIQDGANWRHQYRTKSVAPLSRR